MLGLWGSQGLNAYDREFPHGRYAGEIRNLRGLLAWRTQDWPLALDLTLQTLAAAGVVVDVGECACERPKKSSAPATRARRSTTR